MKLTPREKKRKENRLKWMIKNQVQFLSPTISPAPKNGGLIESPDEAIKYFSGYGVTELVVQPKFMGSYCDIYLTPEPETTKYFTRNGYPVNVPKEELEAALPTSIRRVVFDYFPFADVVYIQAELLPWAVLGEGLIEKEYRNYVIAKEKYAKELEIFGKEIEKHTNFNDLDTTKGHIKKMHTSITKYLSDIKPQAEDIEYVLPTFKAKLKQFGERGKAILHPFNVLGHREGDKMIYSKNNTWITKLYEHLQDSRGFYSIRFKTEDYFRDMKIRESVLDALHKEPEGIVVKPAQYDPERAVDLVPALKVRNFNYLVMIYGIDFVRNQPNYRHKRSVYHKMTASRLDWSTGIKLLGTKIGSDDYKSLFWSRVKQEFNNSLLDPQL